MSVSPSQPQTETIPYGCDALGRLTHVLLHRPNHSLRLIHKGNCHRWLFDRVPDIEGFIGEHDRYRDLLLSLGVQVSELSDHVREHRHLLERLPNLTYLHDTAVVSRKGALLSTMAWEGRKQEEVVVREALEDLGIPICVELEGPDDAFEGCLLLSPETILVAHTERHSRKSIEKFIPRALVAFSEVIFVDIPKARRYMHPDTIYNRIDHDLALAYLPAFQRTFVHTAAGVREIDFARHMRDRGVELVHVSDSEQRRLACSFVPLEPRVMIHYDTALDRSTQAALARKGVEIIPFHPDAMTAGGGSLRCLTLRLHRRA